MQPSLLALGALALAALPHPATSAQGGFPPSPVKGVAAVELETVARERVMGSLRPRSSADLAALGEGPLAEFEVREGATLSRDAVIARIDTRRLDAERLMAQADLAQAEAVAIEREAEAQDAATDLEALEEAALADAISQRELRRARTSVDVAKARANAARQSVAGMQSQLALIDVRLRDATLRAPFDCVVVARHAEIGEWVRAGDPIATVVSASRLEAWLDVPERSIGALGDLGSAIELELSATGARIACTGARVVPDVDPRARTFPLVLDVPGDAGFAPGMSVAAWLPVGQRGPALMVPKDAILIRPGGTYVIVALPSAEPDAPSSAMQVPVRIRFQTPTGTAIEPGGVQAGSIVVTEGNERSMPGSPLAVTVVDWNPQAAPEETAR